MRALIFDFDGLIIDTERVMAEAVIEALAGFGATVSFADFGHLFGSTENDREWEQLLGEWRIPLTAAELDALIWPAYKDTTLSLPLKPGVIDILRAAADADWRIGLATGHSAPSLTDHLRRLEIASHFDAIVTAAEVTRGKPAPDIFLAAAERLGVAPEDCVALEDSPHGVAAGLAAGMTVIACPSAVTAHCEFPAGVQRVTTLEDWSLPSRYRPTHGSPHRKARNGLRGAG